MLEIQGLTIEFDDVQPPQRAVEDFSLSMGAGEIVGIVGESGSGKTMTALALMGLLKHHARIASGSMIFQGKDLAALSRREWEDVRGKEISMIFQEPMTSLNPVLPIGRQMEESLRLHTRMGRKERKGKVLDMMCQVGLPQPESLYRQYPHQLSGGMRQRVMIGAALVGNPKLMVADEPTTALDVTIQAQILSLLKKLNQEHGTAILFISHDLRVIRAICSRVVVMCQGRIMESGDVGDVMGSPQADYTKRLLDAVPCRGGIRLGQEGGFS